MKITKQKLFKTKEVSRVPKDSKIVHLECLCGGYYLVQLHMKKYGQIVAYIGGGTESEPIMKVEHEFDSEESALFYAMYVLNREDIGT